MRHVWPLWAIGIIFLVLYALSWVFVHLLYNGFLDPEVKMEEKPEGLEPIENAENWLRPLNKFEKWYYDNDARIWWENLPRHVPFDVETRGYSYIPFDFNFTSDVDHEPKPWCQEYIESDLKYTEALFKNYLENGKNKRAYVPDIKKLFAKWKYKGRKGLQKPNEENA
jgi:hypothetical protein